MKVRLLVLLLFLTGCGQAAAGPVNSAPDRIYVVGSQGADGNLVFGMEAATGQVAVQLPLAAPAPDWKHAYAVTGSRLRVLSPSTGVELAGLDLPGGYTLPQTTLDGLPGGLSYNGRWLVLNSFTGQGAAAPSSAGTPAVALPPTRSSFMVVSTAAPAISERVAFDGWYEFDGIDGSGNHLYLIHHSPDQAGNYNVVLFDFVTKSLSGPIVDKAGDLRVMQGNRQSAITDPGGHWQYSLYRRANGGAFIHTLSLDAPVAWCLDLPGGGTILEQAAWSMAMTPDGQRLYAVNPVLRRAVVYNTSSTQPYQPPPLVRQATWPAATGFHLPFVTDAEAKEESRIPVTVLSQDLSRLFSLDHHGVLVLDARTLKVADHWATDHAFGWLAESSDGAALYGLNHGTLIRIDARTGRQDQVLPSVANPIAILGVRAV